MLELFCLQLPGQKHTPAAWIVAEKGNHPSDSEGSDSTCICELGLGLGSVLGKVGGNDKAALYTAWASSSHCKCCGATGPQPLADETQDSPETLQVCVKLRAV